MNNRHSKILSYIAHDPVWVIMAINLVVFLALHISVWCGTDTALLTEIVALPAEASQALTHPWTALTYMFVQWDFFHLVFNMLWLWTFGFMGMRLGTGARRITVAYTVGGVAGAIVFVLMGTAGYAHGIMIGSSAAVLSVVGMLGILHGEIRVQMMLIGTVRVRWLCAGVIGLVLLTSANGVSMATTITHAVGAVAGALIAMAVKRRSAKPRIIRPLSAAQGQAYERRGAEYGPGKKRGLTAAEQAELDDLLSMVRRDGYAGIPENARRRLFELTAKIK